MAKGYGRPPMGRAGGKGKGGMGMPPGLNMDMIKQAQKMQADMEKTQAELLEKEYSATAGGGVVSATVDGKHTLKSLTIDPEAVDPDDVEMLQDMIIAAVNEAIRTAIDEMSSSMSKITGGMNLPF
jgi:DNA-binding YbaB/EbfC family protein